MTDEDKAQYKKMAEDSKNEPRLRRMKKIRSCCKPKSALVVLEEQKKLEDVISMQSQVKCWLQSNLAVKGIH